MEKYKDQRVGVLVDVQNMYHSARNLHNARANFEEILEAAVAGRKLIRAFAYVVRSDTAEEAGFFDALEKQGYEVKSKDLQIFYGGAKKADWDVGIAVDAITLADKLDAVVLVTGDGDFVPLVEYLRANKGCMVEVMAFKETSSSRLVEACDDFIDLSSDKRFIRSAPAGAKGRQK